MSNFGKANRTHSFDFSDVTGKKPSKESSSDNFWFWVWVRSLVFRPTETKTRTRVVVVDKDGTDIEIEEPKKPSKVKTFFKWFGMVTMVTVIIGAIALMFNADA